MKAMFPFGYRQTAVFLCANWSLDIRKLEFGAFEIKLSQVRQKFIVPMIIFCHYSDNILSSLRKSLTNEVVAQSFGKRDE